MIWNLGLFEKEYTALLKKYPALLKGVDGSVKESIRRCEIVVRPCEMEFKSVSGTESATKQIRKSFHRAEPSLFYSSQIKKKNIVFILSKVKAFFR